MHAGSNDFRRECLCIVLFFTHRSHGRCNSLCIHLRPHIHGASKAVPWASSGCTDGSDCETNLGASDTWLVAFQMHLSEREARVVFRPHWTRSGSAGQSILRFAMRRPQQPRLLCNRRARAEFPLARVPRALFKSGCRSSTTMITCRRFPIPGGRDAGLSGRNRRSDAEFRCGFSLVRPSIHYFECMNINYVT